MTHESRPVSPSSSAGSDGDPFSNASVPRRRLTVIFNPTAGGARGRRLRRTLDALRARGCTLDLRETRQRGDAERFAAAAATEAVDAVVVAGGDGTVNEVINGMLGVATGDWSGALPALGVIPLGTANVLALELGQSLAPEAVAETLTEGPRRPCALAHVAGIGGPQVVSSAVSSVAPSATSSEAAEGQGRLFLLMGGAGFDAHVVENVKLGLKKHTGKLAYVWETLVQALRYSFPTVHGRVDDTPFQAATAVVCNGRLYGGPFVAAPDGDLSAGRLHLILLGRKGLGNVLRYAVALATGRLPRLADVILRPADCIDLLEPVGAPLQADGDVFCRLPVRVTVAAQRIDLIVPPPPPLSER